MWLQLHSMSLALPACGRRGTAHLTLSSVGQGFSGISGTLGFLLAMVLRRISSPSPAPFHVPAHPSDSEARDGVGSCQISPSRGWAAEKEDALVAQVLEWDSGDVGSIPGFAKNSMRDLGRVTPSTLAPPYPICTRGMIILALSCLFGL